MDWQGENSRSTKPRDSDVLLQKRHLQQRDQILAHTKDDLSRTKAALEAMRRELNDVTNKLHQETSKNVEVTEELEHKREELHQEQLLRVNLEAELAASNDKIKSIQVAHRELEHQFQTSSYVSQNETQSQIKSLQTQVANLKRENTRLAEVERSSRLPSAIPVPRRNRRSSSLNEVRNPQLEDELRTCRTALTEAERKARQLEDKRKKAQEDANTAMNEKIALEKRSQAMKKQLEDALQDAKDELDMLRQGGWSQANNQVDTLEYDRAIKERAAAKEQLATLQQINEELKRTLDRKTVQLSNLQDRLDDLEFQDDEELRRELAIAQEEAKQAKFQLETFKLTTKSLAERRASLESTRQKLQDTEREVTTLKEQLRRRDSASAELEAETNRSHELLEANENVKDMLAKSQSRTGDLEWKLQSAERNLRDVQLQLEETETALQKSRKVNEEQFLLFQQTSDACTEAEKRAAEAERKLQEKTISMATKADERNNYLQQVVAQVDESEGEQNLDVKRDSPLPDATASLAFAEASSEALAKLINTVNRLRGERDVLRGHIAFLELELRARGEANEHEVLQLQLCSIRRLQSAEEDILDLRKELTNCQKQFSRYQRRSTASLIVVQRLNVNLESQQTFIGDLEQNNVELLQELSSRSSEVTELEEQLELFYAERDHLQEALEEQKGAVRYLERDDATRTVEIARLKEALDIAKEQLRETVAECDQLRAAHLDAMSFDAPLAQETLKRHIEDLELKVDRRKEQIGIQQDQIRRLEMNLKIAEDAIEDMRTELQELRAQRFCLEEDATTVREERIIAQAELEAAKIDSDSLRTLLEESRYQFAVQEQNRSREVATLVEMLSTSCLRTRKLTTELHLARSITVDASENFTGLNDTVQRLQQVETELKDCKQRLQEILRENDRLQEELRTSIARGDGLADQLQNSALLHKESNNDRIITLEQQLETLSAEVESLEDRLAEGQGLFKTVVKQRDDLELRLLDFEDNSSAAKTQQARIEELETKISQLDAEIVTAHAALEQSKLQENQVEELQRENEKVSETAQELEERLSSLEQENDLLNAQYQELSKRLEEKECSLDLLSNQLQQVGILKEELQVATQKIQDEHLRNQKLSQEYEIAKQSLEAIQKVVNEKNSQLLLKQEELLELSEKAQKVIQLEAQLSSLKEATAQMEADLHEAQQAVSAAASTTVRDAESSVKIVQLETVVASLKEENEELEAVLKHKSDEIERNEDRLIEVIKERKKLMTKVDSLNRKIRSMQKQLDLATGATLPDAQGSDGVNKQSEQIASAPTAPTIGHSLAIEAPPTYSQSQTVVEPARPRRSASRETPLAAPSPSPMGNQAMNITSQPAGSSSIFSPVTLAKVSTSPVALPSTPIVTTRPPISNVLSAHLSPQTQTTQPNSITTPIAAPVVPVNTPPSTQSSRKRRLPDDFDPSPDERLPAMPILAATPSRLRRVLREGPLARTGFTPSRSRKNSTSVPDKEASSVAVLASQNVVNDQAFNAPPAIPTIPPLFKEFQFARLPSPSGKSLTESRPLKGMADVTNNQKRPRAPLATGTLGASSAGVKAQPRARSGWLNRTGTSSAATGRTTTTSSSRRIAANSITTPSLGSGAIPRGPDGEFRVLPSARSTNNHPHQ